MKVAKDSRILKPVVTKQTIFQEILQNTPNNGLFPHLARPKVPYHGIYHVPTTIPWWNSLYLPNLHSSSEDSLCQGTTVPTAWYMR